MSKILSAAVPDTSVAARWRWVVVMVLFGSIVTGFFDRISVAVLFTNASFYTTIGTGFNPAKLGLLMTAFLMAYGVSAIFLSVLGDIFGPSRTLGAATGIWGVVMMCMGASSSYGAMILARVVLGITEGPQFSLVAKLVQRWFPPRERARANAIWMVGSPIGSAIGFPLTIWLSATYGWRASFYLLGALSLLVVMPAILGIVKDRPPAAADSTQAKAQALPKERPQFGLVFRNYRFWLLTAYGCGLLMYLWGLNSWLPAYLERSRHFNLRQMGIFSSLPFICMFVGEISAGIISDRTGRRALLCFIGLFGAGVLMYIGTIVNDPHMAAVVIALSAGCWGLGLPTQYALAMDIIPASTMAAGIGALNGISNLAGACAPALIGWIIGRTGNFDTGLLVIVIAAMAGACLILPLTRQH